MEKKPGGLSVLQAHLSKDSGGLLKYYRYMLGAKKQ